jgi:hypothetical protein
MRRYLALALVTTALLSGCTQTVAFDAAADGKNALCAEVVVRLPDEVGDSFERRQTNSQGTAAWGDPSVALLRCGVEVPGPTSTLPCVQTGSIYWLRDGSDENNPVFITYGREPATEVIVNREAVSPGVVLLDVSSALGYTTETGKCTEVEDSLDPSTPN